MGEIDGNRAEPEHITTLLRAWGAGDKRAFEQLLPLVEVELRGIARRQMAGERPDHVLQPTALVNEAYLRMVDLRAIAWQDRAHFFAMAARIMRRILVDFARAQRSQKRGAAAPRVSLDAAEVGTLDRTEDIVAIDEALSRLGDVDARKAKVVELRYFGGLSVDETAEVLQVSPETVMRDWKFAKVWLMRTLT